MKSFITLLAILYVVSARSVQDNKQHRYPTRLRNPYDDYINEYYDRFEPQRRDEDMMDQIKKLLKELSERLKPPPPSSPPPQIIYVPYPYPVPYYSYPVQKTSFPINATNTRFGEKDPDYDPKMNWGQISGDTGVNFDDSNDGAKPVFLQPAAAFQEPQMPPVQLGVNQDKVITTTEAPEDKNQICLFAIVICCEDSKEQNRGDCFSQYNCSNTYSTNLACNKSVVKRAFDTVVQTYGPR